MLAKVCEHKNEMKMNSEALKASPGMVTPYSYSSYGQLEGITHTHTHTRNAVVGQKCQRHQLNANEASSLPVPFADKGPPAKMKTRRRSTTTSSSCGLEFHARLDGSAAEIIIGVPISLSLF